MISFVRTLLLVAVTGLAVSCGSLSPVAVGPRFHEGAAANLVLIYYGAASIFITKPDTRENGFLPLLTRKDIARRLEPFAAEHNLAVVVIGRMAVAEQAALIQDWQAALLAHGFRRVVCLQAGNDDQIDGLLILRDSAMAMRDVETGNHLTSLAPAP